MSDWSWHISTGTSSTSYVNQYGKTYVNLRKEMEQPESEWKIEDIPKYKLDKEIEEPQTVFHFDPKGIVDKWPKKES